MEIFSTIPENKRLKRIQRDWQSRFGYFLLMLETFAGPTRFIGTIYHFMNVRIFLGDGYNSGERLRFTTEI
jgi:hypothetical protein